MSLLRLIILTFCLFHCVALSSQKKNKCSGRSIKNNVIKDSIKFSSSNKKIEFEGPDGPYIINDTLYRITAGNKLVKEIRYRTDSIPIHVSNQEADQFFIELKKIKENDSTTYDKPDKLIAISDIEGNYNAFAGFLINNNVMDANHNWIFGSGHLVLLGDFVDRGKNVRPILWLIYKLEQQAKENKGKVHFILGNHEVLNFHGDFRYNQAKYIKVAQKISGILDTTKALKFLYSINSILGKWLSTKNVVEKIGDYIFVHGGLHPKLLEYNLSLEEINEKVRFGYHNNIPDDDKISTFLYSGRGPFWYRGLVMSRPNYAMITESDLEDLMAHFKVEKLVVGHSPVEEISSKFNGKVIRLDVAHGRLKCSGKTKGILIEDGKEYIVDDIGKRKFLE